MDRLNSKTLEDRFRTEICHGLNCSPFEAEAVLQVVQEVYFPVLDQHQAELPPGKISLVLVAADEPAGKPLANCQKQSVCLTVHRGGQDDVIIEKEGTAAFDRLAFLMSVKRRSAKVDYSPAKTSPIASSS